MEKYIAEVKEFRNITAPDLHGVTFRMGIQVIPEDKMGQPDEKKYVSEKKIVISCSDTLGVRRKKEDLVKILWWHAIQCFVENFQQGRIQENEELNIGTANEDELLKYDPDKIKYSMNFQFIISKEQRIGFRQ